jgi:hypothetical protein
MSTRTAAASTAVFRIGFWNDTGVDWSVLLFGGLLTLPWIGQVMWIALIMAIYIRVILVIARKKEHLERLDPRRETGRRFACYDSRMRHIVISDSDGTWVLAVDADPRKCVEIEPTLSQNASLAPSQKTHTLRQAKGNLDWITTPRRGRSCRDSKSCNHKRRAYANGPQAMPRRATCLLMSNLQIC